MKDRIIELYRDHHIDFYAVTAGPFIMGTIHLVTTILHFSWLILNYCLFCYIFLLIRALLTYLDKAHRKDKLTLAGAVSLIVLMIPMTVAMVKTIREKDAPAYVFFWMIYLYATYGTVKFILAIRGRRRARISGDAFAGVMSWMSLVSAAYTLQMMEFALIATFDTGMSHSMLLMQYFTHGAILIFTIFVIVHLLSKYRRWQSHEKQFKMCSE